MMYFLYKNLNLLNNYIINLVFNHFPFARIQGDVLFKLSIKSEMLLLGLLKKRKEFHLILHQRRYALKRIGF
jgi:hypothetical protein